MKKYIYTPIYLVFVFVMLANYTKAQTQQQQNLDKYWHYRSRLVNYFLNVGMGTIMPGQSIPAVRRNGSTNMPVPDDELYWGDDGRMMGYYIGTLATEYRLLKNNGQNTNETVTELFYALHALFRLDSIGITNYENYAGPQASHGIVGNTPIHFPGYGFMIADDVPSNFHATDGNFPPAFPSSAVKYYQNDIPYFGNVAVSMHGSGVVGPVIKINSNYDGDHNIATGDAYSADNYIAVLMGLTIAVKCLDNNINTFVDQNGTENFGAEYTDLQNMAKELGQAILQYTFNSNFELKYPDGQTIPFHDMAQWQKPLEELADNFYGFVDETLKDQVISIDVPWNTLNLCEEVITNCNSPQVQNIEETLEMSTLSNDGAAYSSARLLIENMGDYNTAVCPICSVSDGNSSNHYGWNLFYMAIYQLLYPSRDNLTSVSLCDYENILTSAPYEGPFCHSDFDYAGGGWASDRRFIDYPRTQSIGYEGSTKSVGNYNGLDYMLFYNLYCLTSQAQTALNENIVVNNASNAAVAPIYNVYYAYTGYPDVYPFQLEWYNPHTKVVFGDLNYSGSYDASINSNPSYCNPIIINQLTVSNNRTVDAGTGTPYTVLTGQDGKLNVNGGEYSYIDMRPVGNSFIIIQKGSYFDAKCDNPCCAADPNDYISEFAIPSSLKTKQQGALDSTSSYMPPPYKVSPEFITLPTYDAILNYPNPFTSQTTFEFAVKESTPVSIAIYDTHGEKLEDIISNKMYNQGSYAIIFDGSTLTAGTYICTMTTTDDKKNCKLIKTK